MTPERPPALISEPTWLCSLPSWTPGPLVRSFARPPDWIPHDHLAAPDDTDQYSQDLYRSLRIDNDGLHVLVGRLEPDSSLVAEVTLERYLIIDHGHDALAVLRFLLLA